MAYTAPATAVAGSALTAAFLNTNLRDNIAWMATDSPACRAYNSVTYGLNTASETILTLDSERFDNATVHSTSVNTGRFTVPTGGGGKYLIGGNVEYVNSSSGTTRNLHLRLNGTTAVAATNAMNPSASAVARLSIMCTYAMVAAEYVEMTGFQDTGVVLNISHQDSYSPEAFVFWFRT